MNEFREVDDADPALGFSPMVCAMQKIFAYITERGGIPLTASKAFKRAFVHWAAAEFEWPGYLETDLFAVNKVLNEIDFGPLMELHDLMIALKIGRHYKGQFLLSKAGQALVGQPGRLFVIITPVYLFEVDHQRHSQRPQRPLVDWGVFLNVINIEAEDGATGGDIRRALYGKPASDDCFDGVLSSLYLQVLRPLCWTGLLREDRAGGLLRTESMFTKTSLWRAGLRLDTDDIVSSATRH